MHDFQEQRQTSLCDSAFVVIFFKTMYNKTVLDEIFVISEIIEDSASVTGRGW